MSSYRDTNDAGPYAAFSGLFTPTEATHLAIMVNSTERMFQQTVQKRMIDESMWARNRVMSKLWFDADLGTFTITNPDANDPINGTRMSGVVGYDLQVNPDTIIGFNAGYSMSNSTEDSTFDLSYVNVATGPVSWLANREIKSEVTTITLGGYLMSKMESGARVYISANGHAHSLTTSRTQDMLPEVTDTVNATSFTGEIGVVHHISEQAITGNLFARFVQNSGFNLTTGTEGGEDFMDIVQDQYMTFAPGYSLTFQRRIFMSPTFIMRPYLTVGAEYEVMGMDNKILYKFAISDDYSEYELDYSPLWAKGQVGLEFLSISGVQFGMGYGFHYNQAIQMHNINISASMRF
jgi:hypothetical protein